MELTVESVAHGGSCVAREPSGRVVFVRHALPGERVIAEVTGTTAGFARADAVEILTPSPDRVEPPCPHARPGGCGGCDWQHASLPAQRRLKAEVVASQLRRIAGIDRAVTVEAVDGDTEGLGWRTRVRFSVGRDGVPGLLAQRSHDVVAVGDCPLAHPLVKAGEVTGRTWDGASSVEVVVSPGSGERSVTVRGRRPARPRRQEGPPYLNQVAADRFWRTSPDTFWQVHPGAADVLTTAVLDALAPEPGDVALDLYCGAGLFAGALAAAVGPDGAVIGVDGDRTAARDARHNLREFPWARIHVGDVARMLARGGWRQPTLAVLDPPRTGAARQVIEALLTSTPAGQEPGSGEAGPAAGQSGEAELPAGQSGPGLRRIAYVSCDPATLARDLTVFAAHGWHLDTLRAFDLFPMTHHVECVAVLTPG